MKEVAAKKSYVSSYRDIFSECKLLSVAFTERQNSFLSVLCRVFSSTCVHEYFGLLSKSAQKVKLLGAASNVLFGQGMRLLPYSFNVAL